jgi:hypothetical protein
VQDLVDHRAVTRVPVPGAGQAPAIHDVADKIEEIAVIVPEEIQQQVCLAASCSQVNVRDPDAAMTALLTGTDHDRLGARVTTTPDQRQKEPAGLRLLSPSGICCRSQVKRDHVNLPEDADRDAVTPESGTIRHYLCAPSK